MPEYRMTDQTVTTIALHGLINDMHHVLSRIAYATLLAVLFEAIRSLQDVQRGEWFAAGIDACMAAAFALMLFETVKRRGKYRPATRTAPTTAGEGERGEG